MNPDFLNKWNGLVTEASKLLVDSQDQLTYLVKEAEREALSPEEEIISLQLVLEYRLSNQDALVSLLKLDKHLLYVLGIQPQHSEKTNLERIAYALGNDDLKQVLHALNQLLEHLLRVARRHQNQQKERPQQKQEKTCKIIKRMRAINLKQSLFLNVILTLEKSVTEILTLEAVGPIHDHIAAIRGPVSQFHQAILHGLAQSQILYEHVNKNQTINLSFDSLIKKTEQVLQHMPSIYKPQPNYSPGHFVTKTAEELEERAAIKRMRPFFN